MHSTRDRDCEELTAEMLGTTEVLICENATENLEALHTKIQAPLLAPNGSNEFRLGKAGLVVQKRPVVSFEDYVASGGAPGHDS